MSMSSTTPPPISVESVRHSLLWRVLPLLAVALLLFWLSEGFLAMNWRLLFQVKAQFTTSGSEERIGLLLPLLILVAQGLAMSVAWGALIWLAEREGVRLLTMLMGKKTKQRQPDALPAPAAYAKPTEQTMVAPQQASSAQGQMSVTISEGEGRLIRPFSASGIEDRQRALPLQVAPTFPLHSAPTRLLLPGRVEIGDPEGADIPAQQKELMPTQMRMIVEALPSVVDTPTQMMPAEKTTPTVATPDSSVLSEDEEEFDLQEQESSNFSAALKVLGFLPTEPEQSEEITEARRAPAENTASGSPRTPLKETHTAGKKKALEQKEASSPYDVQKEAREVFQEEKLLKGMAERKKEEQAAEPEQIFVFGNPFDGPLPDVFQHDEELKRSILEQNQTAQKPRVGHEPTKTRARAKKPRTDVPAPPQKHS